MPAHSTLENPLERQLLLQLGERLRAARLRRGITSVELAKRVCISRSTLHAVETGAASATMGTYLKVLVALGLGADLALVGSGAANKQPVPSSSDRHVPQDRQSWLLHEVAVNLVRQDPSLVAKAQATLSRWMATGDPHTLQLWQKWRAILEQQRWNDALADSEEGRQLRQASPLTTLVPQQQRLDIIKAVRAHGGSALASA
ncbi:helix-turn-helix transcriptional regulator [Variovorax paradoxus]|nr:helix-turn-helix transcriptional regulator [Variovorax paradoxus]